MRVRHVKGRQAKLALTDEAINLPLSTMAAKPEILKFAPFASSVDVGFWFELAKKKLDELRLDERELPITGFFGLASSAEPPARFSLEASSFSKDFEYAFVLLCWSQIAAEARFLTPFFSFPSLQGSSQPFRFTRSHSQQEHHRVIQKC